MTLKVDGEMKALHPVTGVAFVTPKLSERQIEALVQLVERGPVHNSILRDPFARDELIMLGYAAPVIINGFENYCAATYAGGSAYKKHYGNSGTMEEAKKVRRKYIADNLTVDRRRGARMNDPDEFIDRA